MTWLILGSSAVATAIYSLILIRLGVKLGLICLIAPLMSVVSVFVVLRIRYTLFELGPFIVVPLFIALVLSVVVASAICWLSMRKSS